MGPTFVGRGSLTRSSDKVRWTWVLGVWPTLWVTFVTSPRLYVERDSSAIIQLVDHFASWNRMGKKIFSTFVHYCSLLFYICGVHFVRTTRYTWSTIEPSAFCFISQHHSLVCTPSAMPFRSNCNALLTTRRA